MRGLVYLVLVVLVIFTVLTVTGVIDVYKEECNGKDSKSIIEHYNSALNIDDIKSACSYSGIQQESVTFSEYLDVESRVLNVKLDFIKMFSSEDGSVTLSVYEYDSAEHAREDYISWLNSTKENSNNNKIKLFEEKNDVGEISFVIVQESEKMGAEKDAAINVGGSTIYFVKKDKMIKIESQENVVYDAEGSEKIKPSICNIEQLKSLARVLVERVD